MPELLQLIPIAAPELRSQPIVAQRVSRALWSQGAQKLAEGHVTLLSLWASPSAVNMALLDDATKRISLLRVDAHRHSFPSVGRVHPAAQRLERTIADIFGITPEEAPDTRPWLDHGRWGVTHPMGEATPQATVQPYAFLPVEGESLHQVAVGPVHAGIIEPGHFRFTVQGETVVRLEQRLGYSHKGTDSLMAGASIARGAQLAGRTSGDSTVAYAWAFAQAVEAASATQVPERALWLPTARQPCRHVGLTGSSCSRPCLTNLNCHP